VCLFVQKLTDVILMLMSCESDKGQRADNNGMTIQCTHTHTHVL